MCNITLVCTVHDEIGFRIHNEFYAVLENIKPEVIFEEMPPFEYDEHYEEKSRNRLESNVINKYLETHKVEHIPVDCEDVPDNMFEDYGKVHRRVEDISSDYKRLVDWNREYKIQYGINYLNRKYSDDLNNQLEEVIKNSLELLNDESLFNINKTWNDFMEKRENEMIKNIYEYTKNHKYNQRIFYIGAAHRTSIIEKIKKYAENSEINIRWCFDYFDKEDLV